jgi:hypothetical protein
VRRLPPLVTVWDRWRRVPAGRSPYEHLIVPVRPETDDRQGQRVGQPFEDV